MLVDDALVVHRGGKGHEGTGNCGELPMRGALYTLQKDKNGTLCWIPQISLP